MYESAPHGNTAKQGDTPDILPWLPLDERFNSVKNAGASVDRAMHATSLHLVSSAACADIRLCIHQLQ